ncbi:MAG: hypothetical protein CL524_01315 [Aequorivita sp.]|nr:hypothetical protein [Aequorivita sp.]
MGTYVSTSQLAAHMPYRTFDSNTSPSTTDLGNWIDEAEAVLEGTLNAAQISTPITAAAGVKIMRSWLTDACVGITRMAFANAGGDPNNTAGQSQIEKFNQLLSDILNRPQIYAQMLGGGAGTTASRQIRSYVTDNDDSKTISGGDFDPTFTTSTDF